MKIKIRKLTSGNYNEIQKFKSKLIDIECDDNSIMFCLNDLKCFESYSPQVELMNVKYILKEYDCFIEFECISRTTKNFSFEEELNKIFKKQTNKDLSTDIKFYFKISDLKIELNNLKYRREGSRYYSYYLSAQTLKC